jgi:hypothetical protein
MRFGAVSNLAADTWCELEPAPVIEFDVELALKAQQDVAFDAPVISEVIRRVRRNVSMTLEHLVS